jgi:replicative DNA helicase
MAADGMGWSGSAGFLADPGIEETERSLLGALLARPQHFDSLPDGFGASAFSFEDHGAIFDVAREAARSGAKFLLPALAASLSHLAGPDGYLRQLVTYVMAASEKDVRLYADTLMKTEARRRLLVIMDELRSEAAKPEGVGRPLEAIVAKAQEGLEGVISGQNRVRGAISLAEAMGNAIRIGEEAQARGDGLSGVTTGFQCLNRRLRGFLKGTLHVIGARPGMGKTALGTQVAIRAALAGNVVLYVSLEMEAEQLAQRALALLADVPLDEVMSGAFADPNAPNATAKAARMLAAQEKMKSIALDIEDEPALTPASIKMRIKGAIRRHGRVDMVIVDHMHLMGTSVEGRRHGAVYATTENSKGLLNLSKEFGVAIVALAQLSREVEKRDDKRPSLADLRESGAIEQDASTVTFLYREAYYATRESQEERIAESEKARQERIAKLQRILQNSANKAELIVAKVRMGQTGTDYVSFDGPRTRFFEGEDRA